MVDILTQKQFSLSEPEWVSLESKLTDGLDLLGLRLPVQYIGNILLSGITTISPTARYLSIRAWMIYEYAQLRLPDRLSELKKFAARVEAALVIGNLLTDPQTVGLIGSDKGGKLVTLPKDTFPLERLVTSAIAFSIYTNPSNQVGITDSHKNQVPGLTRERGVPLVNCINEIVADSRFVQMLRQNPDLDSADRDVLLEFGELLKIDKIPDNERELLIQAIIPEDPLTLNGVRENYRVATYALLLELARRRKRLPTEKDLFSLASESTPEVGELLYSILDGWLLYSIRDLLSVVHEAALGIILDTLQNLSQNRPVAEDAVLATILAQEDDITAPLKRVGVLRNSESWKNIRFNKLEQRVGELTADAVQRAGIRRWSNDLSEVLLFEKVLKNPINAVGLLPIAWLMVERRLATNDFSLTPWSQLISYKGWARLGINEVVLPAIQEWRHTNPLLPELIPKLLQKSIEQHIRIAWTRLAVDPRRNVSLLFREDNMLHYHQNFKPGRSASRIVQAIGWLKQLKLIDQNGLTGDGEMVLSTAYRVLSKTGIVEEQ